MSPADPPAGPDRPAEPSAPLPDAGEARPVHALGFVMTLILLVAVCWLALGALAVTGTIDVVVALALGAGGYAAAAALAFVTSH